MDKRVTRIYSVFAVLGIICSIFSAVLFQVHIYDRGQENGAGSAVSLADEVKETKENGVYLFSMTLPEDRIDKKVIAYDTAHMLLDVTIDGETVYTLTTESGRWMKTTGYQWNFISLTEKDGGKEMVFHVRPAYKDTKPRGKFYYGDKSAVEHLIVKERLPKFIVTCLILITGIILLLYTVVIIEKGQEDAGLRNFVIFAVMLGVWMICESQILELFIPCGIAMVLLDHLMLMLMPLPFVLFIRNMYPNQENRLWAICCYFNCGIAAVRILLQIAGVLDLRETLWMTHVSLCIFVICVFVLSISEMIKQEMTRQLRINMVCVLVLLVAVFLELVEFRLFNKSTPLGSVGFLFYIVVMGLTSVKKSRQMMEQAKENELYRRLAFVDELTGVYNRTAFKRDLANCLMKKDEMDEKEIRPTVLYMFDLNDLKKCNDNFGHEYGDKYIRMISEGIKQVFEGDGDCYRIGGDEFCVITPFNSEKMIMERMSYLRDYVAEKRRLGFVVPVSVAMGYAVYDEKLDKTLEDTMRRADDMMYQNKQEQKRAMKK